MHKPRVTIAINNEKRRNSSPINLSRNSVNGKIARILLAPRCHLIRRPNGGGLSVSR